MPNGIFTMMDQFNGNVSDNDATAGAFSDTGGNSVVGGLIGINAANLAASTAAAVNVSPITQINIGLDLDSIIDGDLLADVL